MSYFSPVVQNEFIHVFVVVVVVVFFDCPSIQEFKRPTDAPSV